MKKSINAWSVDDALDFEAMFAEIKAAGFDGIELNVDAPGNSKHSLTLDTSQEELKEIMAISEKYSLPVVSISSSLHGANMGAGVPDASAASKRLILKQLECAKALGCGGILVVPGGISDSVSIKQAYENSLLLLNSLKDIINETKIYVGVENVWNGFFVSPFDMQRFIDELDCEYIGAYYDVGNVVAFSTTEYWIDILGSRIHNIHVKDYKRKAGLNCGGDWADLLAGDVCWSKVVPALKGAGFDDYLTAEVFKSSDSMSYEEFYRAVSLQLDEILRFERTTI